MIKTQDLTKVYGQLRAINNLTLELAEGDLFGYIGPNGSGKTTTMRILATLLQPTWGEATICGYSIYTHPKEIRRMIGYMPAFFGVYASSLSAFQGAGRTIPTMILGIIRLWLMRIPFSYVLAFTLGLGVVGLWWGMAISNVTSAIAALIWVSLGRWKKGVIEPEEVGDVEGVL